MFSITEMIREEYAEELEKTRQHLADTENRVKELEETRQQLADTENRVKETASTSLTPRIALISCGHSSWHLALNPYANMRLLSGA